MENQRVAYLSTVDNRFDPATEFDKWLIEDNVLGYNTCGFLARVHDIMAESRGVKNVAIEEVIDRIVENDLTGRYIKVFGSVA